ncbi:MAG: transglycosylase SLT domain-containing protein, partial [Bacteroidales bacterium]|nr:transglycosylase SLT domain-containing protein [Bacteroidales bacterium]
MKHTLLILFTLLPFAGLFAQEYDPEYSEPDSTKVELNDQEIIDLNSGKAVVEESAVLEMLDKISTHSYFKDVYLDIDTAVMNVYGYSKNEVPVFPDSVYQQRIDALARESTIPLTYNTHVRSFIDLYANRLRSQSSKMLGLSYVYFPMFEELLDKYNLPLELKYLAMVESALNPTAGSRAGAKGLWQFMLATGRDYGLKVTTLVDERFDPYKETVAACQYLQSLYARYGDWFLVLAAYNSGPGTVNKAILRAGGVRNYWAIWPYLPKETRGYVPAFIAVNYVMNFATEHNLYPINPGLLMHGTDTVMIHDYLTFDQLNEFVGVPMEDMKFFNPQYTKQIIPASPDNHYALRLPMKYALRFVQLEDSVYSYVSKAEVKREQIENKVKEVSDSFTHTVKKGETLASIAKKYHVSVSNIKKWNNLKRDTIHVGQKLTIYRSGAPMAQASKSSKSSKETYSSASTTTTHTVNKGVKLSSISRKY